MVLKSFNVSYNDFEEITPEAFAYHYLSK